MKFLRPHSFLGTKPTSRFFVKRVVVLSVAGMAIFLSGYASSQTVNIVDYRYERASTPDVLGVFSPYYPFGGAVTGELGGHAAGISAQSARMSDFNSMSSSSFRFVPGSEGFPERVNNTGAFFTEPVWTLGEDIWSFSLNYVYFNFERFNGKKLNDLYDSSDPYLNYRYNHSYSLDAHALVLCANYGFIENFDIGVVLPLLSLHGKGSEQSLQPTGTPDEYTLITTRFDRTDIGIGDTLLRFKWMFLETNDHKKMLTVGYDMSLPTGDRMRMMGAGDIGHRVRLLGGMQLDRWFPSFEVGYLWPNLTLPDWKRPGQHNAKPIDANDFETLEYRVSLSYEVSESVTVSGEWLGSRSHLDLMNDVGLSVRYAPSEQIMIQAGCRYAIDTDGLRAQWIPSAGLEVRF